MDIEGAEFHALRGLSGVLAANPGVSLIVETNPEMLAGAGSSAGEMWQWLVGLGYRPYVIPNDFTASAYLNAGAPAAPVPATTIPDRPACKVHGLGP